MNRILKKNLVGKVKDNSKLPVSLGLLVLIMSLLVVAPVASAQEEGASLPEATVEKIESVEGSDYVYIFCNPLTDLRTSKLVKGAKATVKKFDLNVKFFGPEEPHDAESVLAILKKITSQAPMGIAMEIGHPGKFDQAIGEAVEQGIYFTSFSMDDWTKNPRQAYVGYNWREEGRKLAEELFGDMPPLSDILILDSSTKQGSNRAKMKGITAQLNSHNMDYEILTVSPKRSDVEEVVLDYVENKEVDGIVSLWGEVTKQLAPVIAENKLQSVRAGGFGCGGFEQFVRTGSLDVLMKVVTQLEGGISLENLYYSSLYGVMPSTVILHAKPVSQSE